MGDEEERHADEGRTGKARQTSTLRDAEQALAREALERRYEDKAGR
jgi:hypothetical protein